MSGVEFVQYGDAVATYIFNFLGWSTDTTTRYTGAITENAPKSGVQMYKKYAAMSGLTKSFGIESGFIGTLWVLIWCTLVNGNDSACTNNIWADLMLNGGSFSKSDIFYWLNLFTWRGWAELLLFYLFNTIWTALWGGVGMGVYVAIQWMFSAYPMCKAGELTIAGVDCYTMSTSLSRTW